MSSTPFSDVSEASSDTQSSSQSRGRRMGYSRPQQQPFSDSARNRQSVLALGRIDHLQHYFSKSERLVNRNAAFFPSKHPDRVKLTDEIKSQASNSTSDEYGLLQPSIEDFQGEDALLTPLPPSPVLEEFTGSVKQDIDYGRLRKELKNQIQHCKDVLFTYMASPDNTLAMLIEILTMCIRAARTYSTSIPSHQSLAMSFSVFREDALLVLDMLREVAKRNSEAETIMSTTEHDKVEAWLIKVHDYLNNENPDRNMISKSMNWLKPELWTDDNSRVIHGLCVSHGEMGRIHGLLTCYSEHDIPLVDSTIFLDHFRDGLHLCTIYNAIVRRSVKPFGLITRFHQDTGIRYRVTDNLTYWRRAVHYRFDLPLDLDVQEVYAWTDRGKEQLFASIIQFARIVITETEQGQRGLDEEVEKLMI